MKPGGETLFSVMEKGLGLCLACIFLAHPSPGLLHQLLVGTFRVLVVLCDVLTAVTAHSLGADAVANILGVGAGQLQCPILTAFPDYTRSVHRGKNL